MDERVPKCGMLKYYLNVLAAVFKVTERFISLTNDCHIYFATKDCMLFKVSVALGVFGLLFENKGHSKSFNLQKFVCLPYFFNQLTFCEQI